MKTATFRFPDLPEREADTLFIWPLGCVSVPLWRLGVYQGRIEVTLTQPILNRSGYVIQLDMVAKSVKHRFPVWKVINAESNQCLTQFILVTTEDGAQH